MLANIDPDYLADLELNIMGREVSNTQLVVGLAAAAGGFMWWRNRRENLRVARSRAKTKRFFKSQKRKVQRSRDAYSALKKRGALGGLSGPTTARRCMKYSTSGGKRRCVRFGRVRLTR